MTTLDNFYDPKGASFSGKQPMKTVEKLTFLNSLEGFVRYNVEHNIGSYYPVRILPSVDIDDDSETPIVMPAGTIVSVIPIKDARAYSSADTAAGILASGELNVSISVEDGSAMKMGVDYMYDKEVSGLFTVANGGTQTSDSYTNDCGKYGIITLSGEVASSGSSAYVRPANKPMGIVLSKVYSDIRERWAHYEPRQANQGHMISRAGSLTIPYVGVYGSGDTSTVLAAIKAAVDSVHVYAWFTGTTLSDIEGAIAPTSYLQPDSKGKFTAYATEGQKFGKVLTLRNRVPQNIDELIDSVPGSGMKGTDTGGLRAREYHFIKTILTLASVKSASYAADKGNIRKVFYTPVATNTSNVSIVIGRFDIAYGLFA